MIAYCGVLEDVESTCPISPIQFSLRYYLVELMDIEVKGDGQVLSLLQAGVGEGQCEKEMFQCTPEGRGRGGERPQ